MHESLTMARQRQSRRVKAIGAGIKASNTKWQERLDAHCQLNAGNSEILAATANQVSGMQNAGCRFQIAHATAVVFG